MKFLCENCKAKYQIGDERVAGRTLRMKCRKCGHLIEVRPGASDAHVTAPGQTMLPEVAPSEALEWKSLHPPVAHPLANTPPPRPAHAAPPRPAPPRPAGAGLAGAFQKAVEPAPLRASAAPTESSASEWHVGVDGSPVGPLAVAALRRMAIAGQIDATSLVWREELDEWKPLGAVAELASVLEAQRESALPPVASTTPRPPTPAPHRAAPAHVAGSAPRAAVAASASRFATAAKLEPDEAARPHLEAVEPPPAVAAPPPSGDLSDEPAAISGEALVAGRGLSAVPRATVASPARMGTVAPAKAHHHPAAFLVALLCGVLLGMFGIYFALSRKPPPAPQAAAPTATAVALAAPSPTVAAPAGSAGEGEAADMAPIELSGTVASPGAKAGAKAGDTKGAANTAPVATNSSLSGLAGLAGGPTAGPAGPSGAGAGGGGTLASADVERVVQSHRALVRRQCWDPALSGRPANAPTSAKILVQLSVATDGHVATSSANGGDGYPGLASCVQNQVRGWRFPPSDGATINVPFAFAAQ